MLLQIQNQDSAIIILSLLHLALPDSLKSVYSWCWSKFVQTLSVQINQQNVDTHYRTGCTSIYLLYWLLTTCTFHIYISASAYYKCICCNWKKVQWGVHTCQWVALHKLSCHVIRSRLMWCPTTAPRVYGPQPCVSCTSCVWLPCTGTSYSKQLPDISII